MKIFVTVGSTQYNELIKAVDTQLNAQEFDVTIQLADGTYKPSHHSYFSYTQEIEKYFAEADVIITHAGAGSIFDLLEQHKKMVVVPNLERIDSHQTDLAMYVENNKLASVCQDLANLKQVVNEAASKDYIQYQYQHFSGYQLIADTLHLSNQLDNKVAGIPIDLFKDLSQATDYILSDEGKAFHGSAIAINPEKIVRSIKDPKIKKVLMEASIRFADGIGVVKTLRRKTRKKVSRVPGCELWETLMAKSGKVGAKVFLVGAEETVIAKTKEKLKQEYNVSVCGYQNGYFDDDEEQYLIERIAKLKPAIVSVALGSPRQEVFISKCKPHCPETFFMGVGGTYDVYTENVQRAPKLYRNLNLEWFYRLMSQPKRAFRQSNLLTYLWLELTRRL